MVVVPETSCVLRNYETTWFERQFTKLVCSGPMPKHVAFIMDGNRRFAREHQLPHVWEGHRLGGEKMQQVANMLIDLGVEEMTVFSFSVENYKRSPDEVNALMELVTERSAQMLEGMEELRELGVHVEVVANWSKIQSPEMKHMLAKTSFLSKDHKKLKLHLAFAYSAQDEICEGVNTLLSGLEEGTLRVGDLDESLFQRSLSLHPSNNPLDIMIRTSGDHRLSDFQLWQSSTAFLDFLEVPWPAYTYWDLLLSIWRYQHHVTLLKMGSKTNLEIQDLQLSERMIRTKQRRQRRFLELVRQNKWDFIKRQIVG